MNTCTCASLRIIIYMGHVLVSLTRRAESTAAFEDRTGWNGSRREDR